MKKEFGTSRGDCFIANCWTIARCLCLAAMLVIPLISTVADEWTQLGGSPSRNGVAKTTGLPIEWNLGAIDRETWDWKGGPQAKNVLWVAKLGTQSYGSPVVTDKYVFCGTNNGNAYIKRFPKEHDLGCLLCFSRKDGQFLWQYAAPVLPDSNQNWPEQGLCSTPLVEGDRLWIVSNRGCVVCLDVEGFRDNENDGPVANESSTQINDADVVWEYDMINQLGITPRYMTSSSVTSAGDLLFVLTSHGTNDKGQVIRPEAPSFLALNKHTGKLLWSDNSPGDRIMEGQWSSPAYAILDGVPQVIFGGGDGWVYSFRAEETATGRPELLWKFDANPKNTRYQEAGMGDRNYLVAAPVVAEGRVYIVTGRDPQWGEGPADLWCIDPTKRGDVSAELVVDSNQRPVPPRRTFAVDETAGERVIQNPNSAVIWHYRGEDINKDGKLDFEEEFHRTIGMPAIADGLLIVGDLSGVVHCLDAVTGKALWTYDMMASIWGSPLIADGKIYIGDEDGDVAVFALSRERQLLAENAVGSSVYTAPAAADGVLYIASQRHLIAIKEQENTTVSHYGKHN